MNLLGPGPRPRSILGASVVLLMSSIAAPGRPSAPAAPVGPNVILVIVDGLGVLPHSRSLDRVAAHGRRFENAYATAAARGAARWSLLTGCAPRRRASLARRTSSARRLPSTNTSRPRAISRPASALSTRVRSRRSSVGTGPRTRPGSRSSRRAIEVLGERRDRPLFLAVGLRAEGRGPAAPPPQPRRPRERGPRHRRCPRSPWPPSTVSPDPGGVLRPRAQTADERKRRRRRSRPVLRPSRHS